jgi:uncharacterized protein (DUF58 family)
MAARELRIATLGAAPMVAAVALSLRSTGIVASTAPVLAVLWMAMVAVLFVRSAQEQRRRAEVPIDLRPAWHQFDVLTATGGSMMWTSTAALIASGITGWASLAVLGVLGLGVVFIAATWTMLAAGGDAPWRRATITRAIVPEVCVEGDRLREQVQIAGARIPAGMRLFASGRALPDGAITRYAIGSECSQADVRLDSDIGLAARGEHNAPPLQLWLGDILGLTRTQPVEHGEARFSVMPKPAAVDGARALLGGGGEDANAQPTQHQPTDGTFRIREYAPGDDTRRIHWVRSLQANQLVVRLPDEIPQDDPAVRIVLDNDMWAADMLTCRAPRQLLDALVRVWLGVGRALADAGIRVTLVAVADHEGHPTVTERPIGLRSVREAQQLGGRVTWQTAVPLPILLEGDAVARIKHVVVSSRPRKLAIAAPIAWVVVPEIAWTSPELPIPARSAARLPFPSGSAENRLARRRRVRRHREAMWNDRAIFSQCVCRTDWATFSGDLLARPYRGRVTLEAIP